MRNSARTRSRAVVVLPLCHRFHHYKHFFASFCFSPRMSKFEPELVIRGGEEWRRLFESFYCSIVARRKMNFSFPSLCKLNRKTFFTRKSLDRRSEVNWMKIINHLGDLLVTGEFFFPAQLDVFNIESRLKLAGQLLISVKRVWPGKMFQWLKC